MFQITYIQMILIFSLWFSDRIKTYYIPLRFRKAGRVWCAGARETH